MKLEEAKGVVASRWMMFGQTSETDTDKTSWIFIPLQYQAGVVSTNITCESRWSAVP